MKKRIVTLALVVALLAIGTVGTLAYFTDTEHKDNVFTNGKVDIDLNDEFVQESKLYPGVMNGTSLENAVSKEVSVTNRLDSSEAYVRVHIAIPTAIVDKLHTISTSDITNWSWKYSNDDHLHHSTPEYETTIDGIAYTVTVVTYEKKLAVGEKTTNVFDYVWLEPETTSEELAKLGANWHIYIAAEAVQAEGFEDAYTALQAAFGTPGEYTVEFK